MADNKKEKKNPLDEYMNERVPFGILRITTNIKMI